MQLNISLSKLIFLHPNPCDLCNCWFYVPYKVYLGEITGEWDRVREQVGTTVLRTILCVWWDALYITSLVRQEQVSALPLIPNAEVFFWRVGWGGAGSRQGKIGFRKGGNCMELSLLFLIPTWTCILGLIIYCGYENGVFSLCN